MNEDDLSANDMTIRTVDPDIQRFLDEAAAAGAPPITAGTVEQARAGNAAFLATMVTTPEKVARVEDATVQGAVGPLAARRYHPFGDPIGHVVFFHGGGWVLGDLDGHDQLCRQVCSRGSLVVTHVNYRHAPEHLFPAPALDAGAAVRSIFQEDDALPLVVMGDSSGGNLAASAALQARDAAVRVAAQVLLYPVLDCDFGTASYERNADGYLLTRDDMQWFWSQYVPDCGARNDPLASPLRAPDLNGVAPAIVVVAGFDPLHDEGVAYAERLSAAGSTSEVQSYPSMIHGFSTLFALTPAAEASVDTALASLAAQLHPGTTVPTTKENH